jgi:hypothetical protein
MLPRRIRWGASASSRTPVVGVKAVYVWAAVKTL